MKKYKLLKWYPSLPTWVEECKDYWYKDGNILSEDKTYSIYVSKEELKNIRFWQEKSKTEDGFYIDEEKDFVWLVFDNFTKVEMFEVYGDGKFKVFKHESNADEYILWNKPLLTLHDIDKELELYTSDFDKLIKLAKERI